MKKISVTTWIILAGIFLYTASLWQRPLFISEFASNAGAINAFTGNTAPCAGEALYCALFKLLGMTPFSFRIVPALLALFSAGIIFLAGSFTSRLNTAKGGAIIFLLMPAVFLSGTSALSFICSGGPVLLGFFLLFMVSESKTWQKALLPGVGAAAVMLLSLRVWGGVTHLLFLLITWCFYAVLSALLRDVSGEKKKIVPLLGTLLPFLPALALIPGALPGTAVQLPRIQEVKTVAAFVVAGSFPWVIFLPALLRNFPARFSLILHERFTLAALVLAAASLAAELFTPAGSGFFIPCLAGGAILLAAGLEMEHAENGFRSSNVVLWILAVLFFLGAAAVCTWGALSVHTKLLKPAWKLFNAKDAWLLSAVVPAVAAVWCLTAAGEKISKERKFLALCAGIGFILLAFHGLVPLRIIENNAPANFLRKAVMVRTGTKAVFYGDTGMYPPLQSVFRNSPVRRCSSPQDILEIKKALQTKERICVVTTSRSLSNKLPFPKTTLRSGSFIAVFYNIDFPEMQVRKP